MKVLSRLNKIDIIHSSSPAMTFDDFQTEQRDREYMKFVSLKNSMLINNTIETETCAFISSTVFIYSLPF
jgi:hypothetical protein